MQMQTHKQRGEREEGKGVLSGEKEDDTWCPLCTALSVAAISSQTRTIYENGLFWAQAVKNISTSGLLSNLVSKNCSTACSPTLGAPGGV